MPFFFPGLLRISGKSMDLLGALSVLVRVVETGSFSAVARERKISQTAVARQISQLEEYYGVRLLHRTTRKLNLTDDGQMLLGMARPVVDGIEGIEAALRRQSSSPVGLVRVGITVAAGRFLAPRLSVLLADHPLLKVELVLSDRFGDMIEDRLDLAVSRGEITDASLVVRRAGTSRRVAVATQSYLERHRAPSVPAELAAHRCLVHDTGPDSDLWTFSTPEETQHIRVAGGFIANDAGAVHLATRSGQGIAFLSLVEVFDDLRAGQLVQVLSDFPSPGLPVYLAYPSRRHLAPRTRLVMDFILETFRKNEALLATL
jgi:DNA-binding transcriptional LysR family regulator